MPEVEVDAATVREDEAVSGVPWDPEPLENQCGNDGIGCTERVSLTVITKTDTTFSVSVVAFTQERTTLLDRTIGEAVNLETDIMMRYVTQALQARGIIGPPTR